MDSTVIAAIIGGLFTILASIATFIFARIFDKDFWATRQVRQIALDGRWEAMFHQEVGPEGQPIDFPGTFIFRSGRQGVQGEAMLELTIHNKRTFTTQFFKGRFVHERFLKLEYQLKDMPGTIQFGFLLAELSTGGNSLEGHFLGVGAVSQRIIWGIVQAHKEGHLFSRPVQP